MSSDVERDACELAVKKTLAYRSIFKYPLSLFQLKTFLVSDKKIKYKTLLDAIEHLVNRKFIIKRNGKYYLPGVNIVHWEERKKATQKLIEKNRDAIKLLSKIPWVKMVGITGSASAYNSAHDSDLDVLIISEKNRVWITRFFATVLLKIIGKFPNTDGEPGKICTNLFMDTGYLSWQESKRNIFIAHDIVLIQPVFNKGNAYFNFLNSNSWVSEYFPNFYINKVDFSLVKKRQTPASPVLDFIETIFMKIQIRHMKKKQTTEITTKNLIHFNKNDNSEKILTAYKKVLTNRNIS